jgi:hypothetical protein
LTAGAWFQRLNLQHDAPISNLAFKSNLCRYTKGKESAKKAKIEKKDGKSEDGKPAKGDKR